ncbi:hypothetical protein [Dyadobacter linearis]|nr:hypothetical protein [Dyadobacter sp. CECT 9623]
MMKVQKLPLLIGLLTILALNACKMDGDPGDINCTEEFRSVGLEVSGEPLTEFYTVRLATSDTLRARSEFVPESRWYWVLDDSYQKLLANRQEVFKFVGKRGSAIVVQEEYTIGADACHIFKVSGK